MRSARLATVVLGLAVLLLVMQGTAFAPTKIAPTKAEAPHPFTIIDTPQGRLVDGSLAVFKLDGTETTINLRTNNPHRTAQGTLPSDLLPGAYTVFFRSPGGTDVEVGPFAVLGGPPRTPSIEPDTGPPGTSFTLTDPVGRMQDGDLAVFYLQGQDPASEGIPATDVVVSVDGVILTGTVPLAAAQGVQHYVSVRPPGGESRFNDLGFFVTAPPQPSIVPASGVAGTSFTITDPQGRIVAGSFALFYLPDSDPALGRNADDIEISPDGTTLTGRVPDVGLPPAEHYVSVRQTLTDVSLFEDLAFVIEPG